MIRKRSVYVYILLGLLVITILIPNIPTYQTIPHRDSGVFLYLGQQILDGKIPYRDVWDHKGPGIYYIDAFGLFLGQGSRWGVWFLEFLSLSMASLIGYSVMSQAFGTRAAIFASILWLVSMVFVLRGGNYTEEFNLPIQFAALYLFWHSMNSGLPIRYMFLIGATLALSFLLKPNGTGIQLAIIILIFFSGILSPRRYNTFLHILALFFGAITIILPVIIYFAWNNALNEFFDSFFRYNFIYTTSTLQSKIDAVFTGLQLLTDSGITITALTAWIVGCFSLFHIKGLSDKQIPMLYLVLIGMPIELFLSSTSGRRYGHYYITYLPIFAILTSLFVFGFPKDVPSSEITFLKRKIKLNSVWVPALLVAMTFPALNEMILPVVRFLVLNKPGTPSVVEHIESYTSKDDYLLMWGAEVAFNFLTKKPAPSRFVYQYPLYTCGYYTEEMIKEFLDDITKNKPLIVDTSSTNRFIPPLDDSKREKWVHVIFAGSETDACKLSPKMGDIFEFINANYSVVEIIEPNQWTIYKYAVDE